MEDEFPPLLEACNGELALGIFIIGLVNPPLQDGSKLREKNVEVQYIGDTSLACAYVAMGLISDNFLRGEQSVILHNKDTTIIFPRNYE